MPKVEEIFKTLTSCGIAQETQSLKMFSQLFCFEQEQSLESFVESVYK